MATPKKKKSIFDTKDGKKVSKDMQNINLGPGGAAKISCAVANGAKKAVMQIRKKNR